MTIDLYSEHSAPNILPLIREIFFLSADPRNISANPATNEAFFDKWTGYYFKHRPDWILLAWGREKLLGYLMCEPNSAQALAYYQTRVASYALFADQFGEYPAHLHMNAHPDARGKGVGAGLVKDVAHRLAQKRVGGAHVITSPGLRNASFYRQNQFNFELQREWRTFPLLFMGRKL